MLLVLLLINRDMETDGQKQAQVIESITHW